MAISHHLSLRGKPLQWATLKNDGVISCGNIVKHLWLTDKIAGVHPVAVSVGFLLEGIHLAGFQVQVQGSKLAHGLISRYGDEATRPLMRLDGVGYVEVGHSIAVGQEKAFPVHELLHPLQPAARLGMQAGIYHGDPPVLGIILQYLHGIILQVDRHVAIVTEIVGEIFLDDILLIATADNEVVDAIVAVGLHDMPQYRLAAYFHHGFRYERGGFGKPGAQSAGEYHCFHLCSSYIYNMYNVIGKPSSRPRIAGWCLSCIATSLSSCLGTRLSRSNRSSPCP